MTNENLYQFKQYLRGCTEFELHGVLATEQAAGSKAHTHLTLLEMKARGVSNITSDKPIIFLARKRKTPTTKVVGAN